MAPTMVSSLAGKAPSPDVKSSSFLEARRAARQSRSRPWLSGSRPEQKGKITVAPATLAAPKVVEATTSSRIPRLVACPGFRLRSAPSPVTGSVVQGDAKRYASRLPRRVQLPGSSVEVQPVGVKEGAGVHFAEPPPAHGSREDVRSSSPRRSSLRGGSGSPSPSREGLVRQMGRLRVSGGQGGGVPKVTQKRKELPCNLK